jgi:hypothetical protein
LLSEFSSYKPFDKKGRFYGGFRGWTVASNDAEVTGRVFEIIEDQNSVAASWLSETEVDTGK